MILSGYDRVRIVNLKSRTDRRQEMEAELARVNMLGDERIAFFDAYRFDDAGCFRRPGSRGAFHSHLRILRDAADAGESVLILQDDCQFLPAIRSYRPRGDTDVLYGGYHAVDPRDLHNSPIIGAHFMGFSLDATRKAAAYLEAFLSAEFRPDEVAMSEPNHDPAIRPPIDGALVWFRRKHRELRTEFAMLSTQRSSRTDIGERRFHDRIWGIQQSAQMVRSFSRTVKRLRA